MKLILGIFSGILVGIVAGFFLHDPYVHTQYYQIHVCTNFFMANIDPNEPEIQETMREQGFKSVKELVKSNCEYWIRNGQTFDFDK